MTQYCNYCLYFSSTHAQVLLPYLPYVRVRRVHHHSSFCFLRACAGGRHSGRCAPWRATGARREWAAPPRAATGRRSSRGVSAHSTCVRPSAGAMSVYLGCRLCTSSGKNGPTRSLGQRSYNPPLLPSPPHKPVRRSRTQITKYDEPSPRACVHTRMKDQLADLLTKGLPRDDFCKLRDRSLCMELLRRDPAREE